MNGNKPFCSVLKLHLPSTMFKESSSDDQDTMGVSDSMPPILPGCRQISENTHDVIDKHTEEETGVWVRSVKTQPQHIVE